MVSTASTSMNVQPPQLSARPIRIALILLPHMNASVLLVSAVTLIVSTLTSARPVTTTVTEMQFVSIQKVVLCVLVNEVMRMQTLVV